MESNGDNPNPPKLDVTNDRRPDRSFLSILHQKEAAFRRIGQETGKNVAPAIADVKRQENQVSKAAGGNPITGEGVTKSGPED